MKKTFHVFLFILLSCLTIPTSAQKQMLEKLISSSAWDSLFPRRAGIYGTHPQGYSSDFYSFKNLSKAADEMANYFVIIRIKKGVWGQRITITKKKDLITYVYSDVESWWYSNTTPETITIVDFETFLNENSQTNNRRELAAFLANISKETTGGWQLPVGGGSAGDYASWGLYFVHEVGYTKANGKGTYSQAHSEYPPDSAVGYYGRGPIQLSWNYNYGQFSKFIYNDKNLLLKHPDSLQENGVLAFKSAIWFWMMPQCPKPSCHQVMHDQWLHENTYKSSKMMTSGFAHTNNIINGGLECRTSSSAAYTQKVEIRSQLYKYYLKIMGFKSTDIRKEDSLNYSTLCYASASNAMEDYANCKTSSSVYGSFGIDSKSVCDSLVWIDGKTYTENGKTSYFTLKKGDKNGNDSLVILNLSILPTAKSTDKQSACNSYKWINGKTYTQNNDTSQFIYKNGAKNGCDSIVTLNLKILPSSLRIDSHAVCHSFKWIDEKHYFKNNDSALFVLKNKSANGCDSIVRLNLKILPIAYGTDNQVACNFYKWIDGKTYFSNTDSAIYLIKGGASNGCDSLVVLHLKILNNTLGFDRQEACKSLVWIDGKTYTENNDSSTFIIKGGASNGCDSLVTLKLIIQKIETEVVQNNLVLMAKTTADSFQWVDCNHEYEPIAGENKSTFVVKSNGNYAVIITQSGCSDTSKCFTFINLKLNHLQKVLGPIIYPNPTNDLLIIYLSGTSRQTYILKDITGKFLKKGYLQPGSNSISLEKEQAGMYYLYINDFVSKIFKIN